MAARLGNVPCSALRVQPQLMNVDRGPRGDSGKEPVSLRQDGGCVEQMVVEGASNASSENQEGGLTEVGDHTSGKMLAAHDCQGQLPLPVQDFKRGAGSWPQASCTMSSSLQFGQATQSLSSPDMTGMLTLPGCRGSNSEVLPRASHCRTEQEAPSTGGIQETVSSLPSSGTIDPSPTAPGFDRSDWTLSFPLNAFQIKLSIPELLATLPKETNLPVKTSGEITASESVELASLPGVPATCSDQSMKAGMSGNEGSERHLEASGAKSRRIIANIPNRFPSSAFRIESLSNENTLSQTSTAEGGESMDIAESFPTTLVCEQDTPTVGDEEWVSIATPSSRQNQSKESNYLRRRQNRLRKKQERKKRQRTEAKVQVDPQTADQPPLESDASFLFAMDVEGLLLDGEAKRGSRKRTKPPTNTSRSVSSSELSEEESDSSTVRSARKKRKQAALKKHGKGRINDKPKKLAPNAFVSVRIPSLKIRDKVKEVQHAMLLSDKKLKSALVPLEKLHLTLMVLRLEGEEEVERLVCSETVGCDLVSCSGVAIAMIVSSLSLSARLSAHHRARAALEASVRDLTAQLSLHSEPLTLDFSGVGNFGKSVVFAEIQDGNDKHRLSKIAGWYL